MSTTNLVSMMHDAGPSTAVDAIPVPASKAWRAISTVAVCLLWMTVSSVLIMLNQHILKHDGFSYPMTLSGMGMAFSGLASFIACKVLKVFEANRRVTASFYITRILPVGFLMASTLGLGNWAYLRLSVSFIQMLKAFTPVMTMVFLFLAGLEKPTKRLIGAVLIIAVGTAVSALGEANFELWGFIAMCVAESSEALRLVMTQTILSTHKFGPIEGLMYLGPACTLWLALGASVYEWPLMAAEGGVDTMLESPVKFLFAASLGFCVNASAYCVIQMASSLTLKILGTVKNAVIVLLGMVVLGNAVGGVQAAGYAVSVGGFALYNYIKMAPAEPRKGAPSEPDPEQGEAKMDSKSIN